MEIGVHVVIESILDLEELKSSVKVMVKIELSWIDPRLTYSNLHENKLNLITTEQKERLWLPNLIVDSSNDKAEILFNDESSEGKIELNKDFIGKTAKWDEVQNSKKYAGSEGYYVSHAEKSRLSY